MIPSVTTSIWIKRGGMVLGLSSFNIVPEYPLMLLASFVCFYQWTNGLWTAIHWYWKHLILPSSWKGYTSRSRSASIRLMEKTGGRSVNQREGDLLILYRPRTPSLWKEREWRGSPLVFSSVPWKEGNPHWPPYLFASNRGKEDAALFSDLIVACIKRRLLHYRIIRTSTENLISIVREILHWLFVSFATYFTTCSVSFCKGVDNCYPLFSHCLWKSAKSKKVPEVRSGLQEMCWRVCDLRQQFVRIWVRLPKIPMG